MSKILVTLILLGIVSTGWSQGTVNFANSVPFDTPADRLVRHTDGTPLQGTPLDQPATYVAQLYYGADASSLQSHTAAPARFRPVGASGAGMWLGGPRVLTGFLPFQTLTLQVVAWDMRTGDTYETATLRGASAPFTYTIPDPRLGGSPTLYNMDEFRGFSLTIIPEPAAVLLLSAAIPVLWLGLRRRVNR